MKYDWQTMSLCIDFLFGMSRAKYCICTPAALVQVADISKLGLAVTATFAIIWAPFLGRTSDLLQVLHRIVPVRRGLYEDYVANFWCTTSLAIKWRSLFSQQVKFCMSRRYGRIWCSPVKRQTPSMWHSDAPLQVSSQHTVSRALMHVQALIRLCAVSTMLFTAPVLVKEVLRPTSRGLLACMASSAFAFYLFSYQVRCWHGQPASIGRACGGWVGGGSVFDLLSLTEGVQAAVCRCTKSPSYCR